MQKIFSGGLVLIVLFLSFFSWRLYNEMMFLEQKDVTHFEQKVKLLEDKNNSLIQQNKALAEDLVNKKPATCFLFKDKDLSDNIININSGGPVFLELATSSISSSNINISKESKFGMYMINTHNSYFTNLKVIFSKLDEESTGLIFN